MDATTVSTPTPASPAPAAPAAPATSAPASAPTPSQRPSFAEAFATDATAASSQTPAPEGAATTAPAEGQATDSATSPSEPKGPIPFDVHKTALENARIKAAEQAKQEFEQQFGWAKTVDRTAVEDAMRLGQLYQSDRAGYIRQVLGEAVADPTLAPLVRSEAARVLGARAPQPVDLSPDIPVVDNNGQVVTHTFSADRVKAIVQHAVQEALQKEVAPLKQDFQTRQDRDAAIQAQRELDTQVQDIYSEAIQMLPGFKEHEAEIAKVFDAMPPFDPNDQRAADKALRKAWHQVVGSTLANRDQTRTQMLDELKTKAAAGTGSVNPAGAAVTATKRPTSFHDASLSWK